MPIIISINFIIFLTFYILCSKMNPNICIECLIISFIGLIHYIIMLVVELLYNKIIINEIKKETIFYLRLYCIITLSLILTFASIMKDCVLNFYHFYYLIFYMIGLIIAYSSCK